ncbi:sigma-54-dependent Fis family transcriptional regulator [Rhodococcoides kyotonense]|uniref:Transcriptional regulator of acetoin/glycerol metabolism n=1 Tax=Rhodococcoides kyotonense TaxID=398843 RepID=A0A239EJS3_9NOCA|nr:GAF domain-containing protein [Rhodococcus kyotonensis]SNS44906.1 Transcriptional regulator of acetoin/glycerol metabolism [Rhodococcus kyotonensis]
MGNHIPGRDLRKARERFFADQQFDESVRDPISFSWERSRSLNVHPDRLSLPYVRDPDLDSPLVVAADPVLRQLADGLVDEPVSVILTSADGVVLDRTTGSGELIRRLDTVNLAPGFSYSEQFAGTNGIGTALETRQPTLVSGAEHYVEDLGGLVCAGVPIIHPISGTVVGVLDVTGWVDDGAPLLVTLARSATAQIEGRLLSQSSEEQTALLNAYLRACRRSPQVGVLALGDDIVLLNKRLRRALAPQDQAAVVEHAADLTNGAGSQYVLTLPGGQSVRLSRAMDTTLSSRRGMAVYHAYLMGPVTTHIAVDRAKALPGIVGDSSSWRHSCQQIAQCAKQQEWVAVSGEPGSGRFSILKASAIQHISTKTVFFSAIGLMEADTMRSLEYELEQDGFSVIIRDVDELPDEQQRSIADIVQGREHAGWIGVTIGAGADRNDSDALVLPFFAHTVHVPALRHRIEDLHKLIPYILRQLSHGRELTLSHAAIRQLTKYSWPGNVAQLREILQEIVQNQRSGTADIDKLPPITRSLSRRTLTPMEALNRDAIVRSLESNGGSKQAAADALGMSRATIYRRIREFGIDL